MFQCDEILNKKWRYFIDNFEDFTSRYFTLLVCRYSVQAARSVNMFKNRIYDYLVKEGYT